MGMFDADFEAGFKAGALEILQAWRQRSGLILFAIWVLLCVPFGAFMAMQRPGDVLFWAPLAGGTAALAYFHYLIAHEVAGKMRRLSAG